MCDGTTLRQTVPGARRARASAAVEEVVIAVELGGAPSTDAPRVYLGEEMRSHATPAEVVDEEPETGRGMRPVGDRLVALVAHELNSPLQTITNLLYLAERTPGSQKEYIEQVRAQVHRMSLFLGQLRQFAQPDAGAPMLVSCNALLERALTLQAEPLAARDVTVDRKLACDLPEVRAVPGALTEAFFELLEQLMEGAQGGELLVRSGQQSTAAGLVVELLFLRSAPHSARWDAHLARDLPDAQGGVTFSRGVITECGGTLELVRAADGTSAVRILLPGAG